MRTGTSKIEVLIFPEGKLVVRGAGSIEDAASMLEMVSSRLSPAIVPQPSPGTGKA